MVQMMNTGSNLGASAGGAQRVNFLITAANMTGPAVMGAMANLQGLSAISMRMGNQLGSTLTAVEGGILAVGAAGAIVAGASSIMAAQYEAGMKQVQAISGATAQEMGYLSQQAKALSMEFGIGFQEVNEGLMTLGRAGFQDTARQADVLRESMMLAKLEGMDLTTALEGLITTTNLLHPELSMDSPQYMDELKILNSQMAAVSQAAPITVKDILQSLKYSGGVAAEADIDQADLLGTIGYFGSKGVKADVAGTAIRPFILRPISQTTQTKDQLKSIGLTPEDLWEEGGNKAKNIADQIKLIDDSMRSHNFNTMNKFEFWQKLVGPKQAQQMLKLDYEGIERYTEIAREGLDLEERMQTILESVQQKWNKFIEGVKTLLINVGDVFLIVLGPLIDGLNWFIGLLATNPIATWSIAVGAGLSILGAGIILLKWFGAAINSVLGSMGTFITTSKVKESGLKQLGVALGFVNNEEAKLVATGQAMMAQQQAETQQLRYKQIATGELVLVNGQYVTSEEAKNLAITKNTANTTTNTGAVGKSTAAIHTKTLAIEKQIAALTLLNRELAKNALANTTSVSAGTKTAVAGASGVGMYQASNAAQNYTSPVLPFASKNNYMKTETDWRKYNRAASGVPYITSEQRRLTNSFPTIVSTGTKKGLEKSQGAIAGSFNKGAALGIQQAFNTPITLPGGKTGKLGNAATIASYGLVGNNIGRMPTRVGATSKIPTSGNFTPIGAYSGAGGKFWQNNFVGNSFLKNNQALQKGLSGSSQGVAYLSSALMGLASPIGLAIIAIMAIIAVFAIWHKMWSDKLNNAKDSLKKNQEAYEAAQKSYDSREKSIKEERDGLDKTISSTDKNTEAQSKNAKTTEEANQKIRKQEREMDKYSKKMELASLRIKRATMEIIEAESDAMWGNWGLSRQVMHAFGQDANKHENSSEGLYMEDQTHMYLMDYQNSLEKSKYAGFGAIAGVSMAIEKFYQAVEPPSGWSSRVSNAASSMMQLYANPQYKRIISLTNANYKYLVSLYDVETEIMELDGLTKEQARNTKKWKEKMKEISEVTQMSAEEIKRALDIIEIGQNLEAAQGVGDTMKEMEMLNIEMISPEAELMKLQNNGDNAWFSNSLDAAIRSGDIQTQQLIMMSEKYAQDLAHEVWWKRAWIVFEQFLLVFALGVIGFLEIIYNILGFTIGNILIGIYNAIVYLNNATIGVQQAISAFAAKFGVSVFSNAKEMQPMELFTPSMDKSADILQRMHANSLSFNKLGKFNKDTTAQDFYNQMNVAAAGNNREKLGEDDGKGTGADGSGSEDGKNNKITVDFVTCRKQIIPKINQMSLFGNGPLVDVHKHTVSTGPINVITRDDPDAIGAAVDNRISQTAKDLYPVTVSTRGVSPTETRSNPNIKTA